MTICFYNDNPRPSLEDIVVPLQQLSEYEGMCSFSINLEPEAAKSVLSKKTPMVMAISPTVPVVRTDFTTGAWGALYESAPRYLRSFRINWYDSTCSHDKRFPSHRSSALIIRFYQNTLNKNGIVMCAHTSLSCDVLAVNYRY